MNRQDRLEYHARLRRLIAGGASLRGAAKALQRPASTVRLWARAAGLAGHSTRLSQETRALVRRKLRSGLTIYRVAKLTGVSTRTVWRHYLDQLRRLVGAEYLPTKPWRCTECGALIKLVRCPRDGTRKPAKIMRQKRT